MAWSPNTYKGLYIGNGLIGGYHSDQNFRAIADALGAGDVGGGSGELDALKARVDFAIGVDDVTWDDMRVPISATKRGGSKVPEFAKLVDNGAGSQGVFVEWFDSTAEEELYFDAQMPHAWRVGTDLFAHVHWVPSATDLGKQVCWGLEYTWANIGSVFGNTSIVYGDTLSVGDVTANKQCLTAVATLSGTGKTLSSMLICRVFRDATGSGGTDDYTSDAGLLELDFHYQIDSLGSDEAFVKQT